MKYNELQKPDAKLQSFSKLDLEEMKQLQRDISTPSSYVSWDEIKRIYLDNIKG